VEERLAMYRQMKQEIGEIHVASVRSESDSSMAVTCTSRDGGRLEFTFALNDLHQLTGIRIERLEGDEKEPPAHPMSPTEFVKGVEELVRKAAEGDTFSGVVLVAKDGVPIVSTVAGFASARYRIPVKEETKFNLGSINKFFTKIATARLLDQKKLGLDDRVGKHIPDYPNRDVAERVTIQQLLNMTSGMGDFFGERFDATPKNRIRSLQDYLPFFVNDTLRFAPGTDRSYSNAGYIVLGLIIERITGTDYYSYVRNTLFAPAGMTNTDWYAMDEETPNLATGYTMEGSTSDRRVPNFYTAPARGSSAGGGYSTAEDLLSLAQALKEGRLLSPASTGWLFGGGEPGNGSATPGPLRGGIGIAGGAPGINAVLDVDVETGYTVIVLSNYDPPSAETMSRQIRSMLRAIR
jgi:CubicO group peptidase (beta-lactamase class C family)